MASKQPYVVGSFKRPNTESNASTPTKVNKTSASQSPNPTPTKVDTKKLTLRVDLMYYKDVAYYVRVMGYAVSNALGDWMTDTKDMQHDYCKNFGMFDYGID